MSTNTVFMFVVISFHHCVSLLTFCLKNRPNKAKQKNLSTLPLYGNSAELFGPGYMSPAVLGCWNTKQKDLFLKSKFRDESGRLLAPRQIETIGEKFVEGTARVNAPFLTRRVFEQEDLVIAALMALPWKKMSFQVGCSQTIYIPQGLVSPRGLVVQLCWHTS